MARLNDPPIAPPGPSVETVDAVKRRYLRQNRELAKINSQQSVRIRNLEIESSRLLAENLQLREHVLQLQNTLEARPSRPSFDHIDAVKGRLEAKILEFTSLVAELGQIPKPDPGPRCKSQTAATRRSPDERQWRSGLGLQEVEDAMLPTIVEDKYYPRRTMNADELQNISEDPDSQSPDLGPPPVLRYESEDPIAFNPSPPPQERSGEQAEEAEPALPINLETRKKRRESDTNPKLRIRRISVFQSSPESTEDSKTVKAGAKRKLSVREDEESVEPHGEQQAEPFRFSRRNTPTLPENGLDEDERPRSPEKPVLISKPVNIDPVVSPKKQRSVTEKADKKILASKPTRGRPSSRNVMQPPLPPVDIPEQLPVAEIPLDSLPPKTPAADELFSPPSTEPSTARPESKDTPPPNNISSDDQTGFGARPSRRARPQVSYKEPSLHTKMRRPDKKLVDAVYPSGGDRRASVEPAPATGSRASIKRESQGESETWKGLPEVNAAEGGDEMVRSPLKDKLDRRDGTQAPEPIPAPDPPRLNSSAASHAISALIASSSKRRSVGFSDTKPTHSRSGAVSKPAPATEEERKEDRDNLAIFDFNDSSPVENPAPTASRPRIDLAKQSQRNSSRRHSSVPAPSSAEERPSKLEPVVATKKSVGDGSLPSLHERKVSGSAPRNSSSTSLTGGRTGSGTKKTTAGLPRGASSGDLRGGVSGGDAEGSAAAEKATASMRAERAASRRKSMML